MAATATHRCGGTAGDARRARTAAAAAAAAVARASPVAGGGGGTTSFELGTKPIWAAGGHHGVGASRLGRGVLSAGRVVRGAAGRGRGLHPLGAVGGGEGSLAPAAGSQAWPRERTDELVLTAMLAAASGLAYFLSSLMRLESYLGSFFPLPMVIAAAKCGPQAARKTMVATCLLLAVLAGPLRATTYFLMHGVLGATLGAMWSAGGRWRQWSYSVPLCTLVRSLGVFGSLALSSWMLRENLFFLILNQIITLLDQLAVAAGAAGGPPVWVIMILMCCLVVLNGVCYVFLIHVLYSMLLKSMGLPVCDPPHRIKNALFPASLQ